ncbi:Arylsulfatase A [Prosthecobacter debontii]|uniref:Arylsulfatase A n=1 Tax=Prosthecobacter debontii TaxID=48467 RepID=A0A1T4WUF1_9BACT|nr:sulfatase [Prosthecobacter debontii]SKA80956.1 Arylsulfatase A [Prosthecobacter debontii]
MKRLLFTLCSLLALTAPILSAAEASRPNVLFIIFDDWGWRDAGAYGSTWVKTPNFDRIAKEGILFKNAYTSNPKCSPCRASILTGRNTWQLEEASCHNGLFPAKFAVYPDLIEASGYSIGLTGKGWGPGDFKHSGRVNNPAGPSFDEHKIVPPAKGIGQNDYSKNFDAFLTQRDKGKPFCFWMGFQEPHRAYELDSGVRLGKKLEEVVVPPYFPDTSIVRGDLADYAVEVEYADAHIGRAIEALEKAGALDNTLIVVTSDHGMPFPYVKGQIHEDGFHLPLAMRWGQGIKAGRVVEDFINVRDFAPTFMELAGLKPHEQMTGKSLLGILKSDQSGFIENREVMLAGKERHDLGRPNDWGYPVRAIRTKDYLYVHNFNPERWPAGNPETDYGNCDPSPTKELLKALGGTYYDMSFGKRPADELYDLKSDPEGVINLANDLAHAPVMNELREKMMTMLKEEGDPRALGNGAIFDTYKYLASRKKGYETWLKAQDEAMTEAIKAKAVEVDTKHRARPNKAKPRPVP